MPDLQALFAQIYAAYGPGLYRFCLMQLKNSADAEDALQEVFVKRLTRAPIFETPEHERKWLFRVAANQCRDEWKRRGRKDLPLDLAEFATADPETLDLLEHVAALPEKQRVVLHLHYYEGYSVAEIAGLLGVTVSAVKMRLNRGRTALGQRLEGEA